MHAHLNIIDQAPIYLRERCFRDPDERHFQFQDRQHTCLEQHAAIGEQIKSPKQLILLDLQRHWFHQQGIDRS
jgi:hypothetical protein